MSYKDLLEKFDFGRKFEYASFENKEEISKGKFGAIFKVDLKDIKQTVALKTLYHYDEKSLDNLIRNVKYTTEVNHDNIIQFIGITQDSETRTYYMVLQYANSGNLQCYLNDHFSELDWPTKIKMAKEISSGIKCLHSEKIAHRNLHDKNILVHDGRMIITDFGLSESLDNNSKSITSRVYRRWEYYDPKYLQSPFMYKRKMPSDIYSLGVIFWELSSGVPPFRALKRKHVIEGDRETPIDGTPVGFKDLYCAAWDGIPDHRPKIEEICKKLDRVRLEPIYKDLFDKNAFGKNFEYATFENKTEISKGEFGVIYKAHLSIKDENHIVALKTLGHDDERIFYDFVREVKYNKVRRHDNIIEFFGITQDSESKKFYIVLQYANGGDLQCYLNDRFSSLDWLIKVKMAKEISNGISYLHRANIVHRNLHDKNIFVHDKRMVITDFGLSKSLNNTKSVTNRINKNWEYFDPLYLQSPLTYEWNKHSDVYSLGVLFWELSSGKSPFRALKEHHVINGDREIPIEGTPTDFKDLYCAAWNGNPDNRPDIEKICKKLKNMQLEVFCKNFSNFKYSFSEKPEKIGEGGFGVIHKVYLEDIKQIVALKTLDHDDEEAFIREVKCTTKVNHDNLIKFFGITHDPKTETYYMILQLANSGDLESYLKVHSPELDWQIRIRMAKEISSGINSLHGANIVHRDLHNKNILVHEGRMIITDFGLSKSLDVGTESISSGGVYGRCEYCDPNYVLDPLKYKLNKQFDVYSIGVLFWELSSGVPPFTKFKNNPIKMSVHLLKGQREDPIEGTPIDFQNLYAAAWDGSPDKRPNIKEICNKLNQIQLGRVDNKTTAIPIVPITIISEGIIGQILEIFKNNEGLDADAIKEKLKTLLKANYRGPDKYISNMEEFAKETFEDFVSEVLNKDVELKQYIYLSGSLDDLSKKTKIVMNLWTDNNEGIIDEKFLALKELMQDVVSELSN